MARFEPRPRRRRPVTLIADGQTAQLRGHEAFTVTLSATIAAGYEVARREEALKRGAAGCVTAEVAAPAGRR